MKRYLACFFVVFLMGSLCRAQDLKAPFDVKKSQEELEIMKGIISTKLSYAAEDSRRENPSLWRFSNINAFYLSGQGAVFIIPTSNMSSVNLQFSSDLLGRLREQIELSRVQKLELARVEAALAETKNKLRQTRGGVPGIGPGNGPGQGPGIGPGQGTGEPEISVPPVPPAPPAPPSPPPPAPPSQPAQPFSQEPNQQELRKNGEETLRRLTELQERSKEREEELKADREKFLSRLAEIKVQLVETAANYGDSLTTVGANERINLVLVTDGFEGVGNFGNRQTRYDVISVQKSWITDYKAGRLTLDSFKQKVVQYTE